MDNCLHAQRAMLRVRLHRKASHIHPRGMPGALVLMSSIWGVWACASVPLRSNEPASAAAAQATTTAATEREPAEKADAGEQLDTAASTEPRRPLVLQMRWS